MGIMELLGLLVFCLGMTVSFPYSTAHTSEVSEQLTEEAFKSLSKADDETTFHTLLKPLLIERVSDTPGNVQARAYIVSKMTELSWQVEENAFTDSTPYGKKEFVNIIATMYPGMEKTLTIACHYDSKFYTNIKFIGATDSAVPCAMMLSMAKTLNDSLWKGPGGKHKDISLQFIFFDGEEAFKHWTAADSLYGSRHLAQLWEKETIQGREMHVTRLKAINVLVLLDLIGTSDVQFQSFYRATDHLFKRLQNIEKRVKSQGLLNSERHSKKAYFEGTTYMPHIEDDHIPFYRRGVPVLHLISAPFPSVWHTANDNEENLDMDTILDLNLVMKVFVAEYMHLHVN